MKLLIGVAIAAISASAAWVLHRRAASVDPRSSLERAGWAVLPFVPLLAGLLMVVTLLRT